MKNPGIMEIDKMNILNKIAECKQWILSVVIGRFFEIVFICIAFCLLIMLCILIFALLNSNMPTQIIGWSMFLIGSIIIYKMVKYDDL